MGRDEIQPGGDLKLDINVACPHSDVALLAVDKGLYILNSENRLSRDKVKMCLHVYVNSEPISVSDLWKQMFEALDGCSTSCGQTVASSDGIFDVRFRL